MSETKAVDFNKHLAEERDYYLGKTDVIPGSGGKTVAEGKKEHRARVDKSNAVELERRQAVINKQASETFTTTVTGGVTVEVQRPKALAVPPNMFGAAAGAVESLGHTKESLGKMTKAQLTALGEEEISHIFPDNMSKDNMVALLLGEKFDSESSSKSESKASGLSTDPQPNALSGSTTGVAPSGSVNPPPASAPVTAPDPLAGTTPGTGTNPTS